MRQTTAACRQIELIGGRVRVHFQTDLVPAPGQCALARVAETFDPYLRQAFFPSVLSDSGFAVDLAPSQAALRHLTPGSPVDLLGPVGRPLPEIPARSRVLLVAETDPAPLLPLAARAIARDGAATLLLAARYPLDALQPELELRIGDLTALTAEFAPAADLAFIAAGPARRRSVFQALAQSRSLVSSEFARALVELPLPCGVGACLACSVKTTHGHEYACLAGPFFSLAELQTE